MQMTIRKAKALLSVKTSQQTFVTEYLGGLLIDARNSLAYAESDTLMRRRQGEVQLIEKILKDIEDAGQILAKLEQPRRKL